MSLCFFRALKMRKRLIPRLPWQLHPATVAILVYVLKPELAFRVTNVVRNIERAATPTATIVYNVVCNVAV